MKKFLARHLEATKVHLALSGLWALLVIPGVTLWKESITFVVMVSIYANFVGHVSSYQAAKSAGVDEATRLKLNAIADALANFMENSEEGTRLQSFVDELRRTVGIEKELDSSKQDQVIFSHRQQRGGSNADHTDQAPDNHSLHDLQR